MYEQILPWIGLGALLILCLPIPLVQRLVLEVSTWALRLGMIALLAGGVYLWFRPGDLPAMVSDTLNNSPWLLALLPDRGSPAFGLCAACWVVAALVPPLAALDVTRCLASRRLSHVTAASPVVAAPVAEPLAELVAVEPMPVGPRILRPVERRTAAAAMAAAASGPTAPAH
jgi:hypothetical protein